jgi:hypothetical protein
MLLSLEDYTFVSRLLGVGTAAANLLPGLDSDLVLLMTM